MKKLIIHGEVLLFELDKLPSNVKKIEIDKFVDKGIIVDSFENYNNEWWNNSQYKIIDMSPIIGGNYAPYLYMLNLTTKIYHLEPIGDNYKKIKEAMDFRFGEDSSNYKILSIS